MHPLLYTRLVKGTSPYLSVLIEDRRGKPNVLRLKHAFLSPIVIRKELENLLIMEGEQVLRDGAFVDSHATLYWNLFYGQLRRNLKNSFDQNPRIFLIFAIVK